MNINPILIIIVTQLLFTTSDLIGRHYITTRGFSVASFLSVWFLIYVLIRNIGMFGQLYVFSKIELGHTMALFGAISIVLANVLGFLLLKEVLTPATYMGVVLAIIAFLVLAIKI